MIADNWHKNMKKSKEKKEKSNGLSVFDHYECDGQMSIEDLPEYADKIKPHENTPSVNENTFKIPQR